MKRLSADPLINPTARVRECELGRYTEVGASTNLVMRPVFGFSEGTFSICSVKRAESASTSIK